LPDTNTLAYLASSSATKEKSFTTLTASVKAKIKLLFSMLLTKRPNKLECLHLAITFQSSLTFAGSIRSIPKKEASERCSNWVDFGLALKF
jgi:hypothetical protein